MNIRKTFLAVMAGLGVVSVAGAVQLDFWNHYEPADSIAPYVQERLEIGFRLSHFTFKDPERATINADGVRGGYAPGISTYTLKEEQSYLPLPYVRYNFTPYVGMQLSWERLEGETGTRDVNTLIPYDHSNGNAVLSGPGLMLYGRYPFDRVAPYAGIGLAFLSGKFDQEPGWHAAGRRNMAMDDTVGYLAELGAAIRLHTVLALDLALSYIDASPDARYWMGGDSQPRAEWEFPMQSWVFRTGLKYTF